MLIRKKFATYSLLIHFYLLKPKLIDDEDTKFSIAKYFMSYFCYVANLVKALFKIPRLQKKQQQCCLKFENGKNL